MRDKENWEIAEDATVCRIFGSATDRPREKVVMLLQVHFSRQMCIRDRNILASALSLE